MNKSELKSFAITARIELLSRVRDRASLYGITEEKVENKQIALSSTFQKIDGELLSKKETDQRNALLERVKNIGFEQAMEEAAYIWFNRFIALKYMEERNLLPIDMRVIPQLAGELPQVVREAQKLSIEGINSEIVFDYLETNKNEELYKYIIVSLCNYLSNSLPMMFEKISDYTELLFPDGLLRADSFLGMLSMIAKDNWAEIQIIGWLYQYYITDINAKIYDGNIAKSRLPKELLPAATQIFTPDWAVRYMIENSLGRLWYEGHPDQSLRSKWKYYLDEIRQENEAENRLIDLRKGRENLQPEEIKLIDPCMGSGHILVYAFDVLMDIYRSIGYSDRDAVQSIIQNNLFGLDIDDRAAQLAYFALMMKASEYDKRFLRRGIQPNVCAIQESNSLSAFGILKGQMSLDNYCINTANQLISAFIDAKEYGSILSPNVEYLSSVDDLMSQLEESATKDLEVSAWHEQARKIIPQLAKQALIFQQKYDVVITNPPYLGSGRFSEKLNRYATTHYPDGKADLSTVMYLKSMNDFAKPTGFISFIAVTSWMFLSSFENYRDNVLKNQSIISLVDFGSELFDGKVGHNLIVAWVARNAHVGSSISAVRLVDYCYSRRDEKEKEFFNEHNRYIAQQDNFEKIPGKPVAYWLGKSFYEAFENAPKLGTLADVKVGLQTGNNDLFLRFWYEVNHKDICFSSTSGINVHWVPHNKAGEYRKWYGNAEYIVNWENNGEKIKKCSGSRPQNTSFYFKEGFSWSDVSSGSLHVRFWPSGCIFDTCAPTMFPHDKSYYLLGLSNSKVVQQMMNVLSPTIHYTAGSMMNVPVWIVESKKEEINSLVAECIHISREDWDSFETSWDFSEHPLVKKSRSLWDITNVIACLSAAGEKCSETSCPVELCYLLWKAECNDRFSRMKKNEEKLNDIFISIYKMQEELTPEIADKDVSVHRAELDRDVRSLISYAVGCMFGRYSIDKPGLILSGQKYESKYVRDPEGYQYGEHTTLIGNYLIDDKDELIKCSFVPDQDGILPMTDDEYFQDDIVSMFVRWVKSVFGKERLEENLQYIANALNPNGGTCREVIRSYFINEFYADHLKIYQKRPIYWQFDSGKQNGFKALMYLHRYDQDTVARLRTDYVHELQDRYRTQLEDARKTAESGDARQRSAANKRAQKLDKQLTELNKYEELVHHYADMRILLDLDDGVKVNYAKLQDILTKIK